MYDSIELDDCEESDTCKILQREKCIKCTEMT